MRASRFELGSKGAVLLAACVGFAFLVTLTACSGDDGDQGPPGPPGPAGPTPTDLEQGDDSPGVIATIVSLGGATGSGGSFKVGDKISVRYTLTKTDGSDWEDLAEFGSGSMMVSGPTFNYQRVIVRQNDLLTRSVENSDGSFTYTFASAIPATYAAPYNDTASFGTADGELTGQALLNGTYTVGMWVSWDFTVDGEDERDAGNATAEFQIGTGTIDSRAVVGQDNCNQCHETLQAHGGSRRDVVLCLMCHTSGSEDSNDPGTNGGTPGVSIDFRVMIHKIHNGAHLPSVLGVSTNPDGSRNYAATPAPYLIGSDDFSHVTFPVWPSLNIAMPRDQGYTALSAGNKTLEDTIRMGVVSCDKCHGDPDGAGPITAPAQGSLHKSQPTILACGSCHDDIDWGNPYTANGQTMGAQANNANCILCHGVAGTPLSVETAHVHPLLDSTFNAGLNVDIQSVVESGTNDGDGTIDPGEKIAVTLDFTDDSGAQILPTVATSYSVAVSGPTNNLNLVLSSSIQSAALTGSAPYTTNLPEPRLLDYVGDATGAANEVFTTPRTPHWNISGAATTVLVRTATGGGNSTLAAACGAPQNYLDLASTAGFARDDYVVIEDGVLGSEEYLRIQYVDGNRLWFSQTGSTTYTPGTRVAHALGASVMEVTLTTKAVTTDYTLNAALGEITEVTEFGAGNAVLVSYTTDFVMPAVYPLAFNDGPDLDQSWGRWTTMPIVDGTYEVGIWGATTLALNLYGESNSYRGASPPNVTEFLVGSATTVERYDLIDSANSCYSCHSDMYFHGGGRRGVETCVLCHGTAGSGDRPQYVAANAPATAGTTINFRTMLHKIHQGEDLAHASSFLVNGFGSGAYPNNFSTISYEEVVFPVMPGKTRSCAACHGSSVAWEEPAERDHPTDQVLPVREWRATCGACHDSDAAAAHIDIQTSGSGVESCNVCHGDGGEWSVPRVHKSY